LVVFWAAFLLFRPILRTCHHLLQNPLLGCSYQCNNVRKNLGDGGGGNKQTNIQNPRKKIQLVGTCVVDPWQLFFYPY
jgi:hypothetical protein